MSQIRLKELCKKKGMTFNDLGEKIGVSRVSLSGIATGKQKPSFDTLEKIAGALNVSLSELFAPAPSQIKCPKCGTVLKIKIERDGETE